MDLFDVIISPKALSQQVKACREKQLNKQVQLNAELKKLKKELEELK